MRLTYYNLFAILFSEMDENQTNTLLATVKKAGLTESQAKGYLALIEHGQLSPAELATHIGESRTNGYQICDKLLTLSLVTKKDDSKALYSPAHPSALEILAEKRRKILVRNEQEVKNSISPLIDMFYANTEMPGTHTAQGLDAIKSVLEDTLRCGGDVYFVRTPKDVVDLSSEYFLNLRQRRMEAGIQTYALTPMTPNARKHIAAGDDEKYNFNRTLLPDDSYSAPIEIQVYGDKTSFIAYGETQMVSTIDSPPVAEAMRQLLRLLGSALQEESNSQKRAIRSAAGKS